MPSKQTRKQTRKQPKAKAKEARKATATKFCSCIKKVKRTLKSVNRKDKEPRAIAICVKSVLHTRGKTLKRFTCRKKMLEIQDMKVKTHRVKNP
jgi:hypothetical protein